MKKRPVMLLNVKVITAAIVITLTALTGMFIGYLIAVDSVFESGYMVAVNEIEDAILSGKSITLNHFVITPDKTWKKGEPINNIWLRDVSIAGAGADVRIK